MGPKKKEKPKPSLPQLPPPPPPPSHQPPSEDVIKSECEKALNSLRRGNHNKALRLMKEITTKHPNSPIVHRVHGTIALKVSAIIDDQIAKQKHLKNALSFAHKASTLSPNSIEFALFYANLLYDAANDGKDYEAVVAECDRALAVESPGDPMKENVLLFEEGESGGGIEDGEMRVAAVQSELRGLIQKANIASISSWMKNLGGGGVGRVGEDGFKFIPMRRQAEDPLESKYLQGGGGGGGVRRNNEIKKATKTVEERRKEIEVRVAAAKLVQHQKDNGGGSSGGGEESVGRSGGSGRGGGERKKGWSGRRGSSLSERKDQVRSFWNSMSDEMKKALLRIRVSDIRAHLSGSLSKDTGQALEILSEALAFGELNKAWKFWACCRCGERFPDFKLHMEHVIEEHMGNALFKIQPHLPVNVESEWAEMLLSCSWKPLDLSASIKMLEDQLKPDGSVDGGENHKEQIDECWDDNFGSDEPWEPFPEKKISADSCDGVDKNAVGECKTCDANACSEVYILPNSWPLSDDTERAHLLGKIRSSFHILVMNKCLAPSHLDKVMQFTKDELQRLASGSQIRCFGVDQNPLCICFLGENQLRKVFKFLQDLCHTCGVVRSPEKVSPDDAIHYAAVPDPLDNIIVSEDASCLLLDDSLLSCNGAVNDLGSASPAIASEKGILSASDFFLSWIYDGRPSGEQLATWSRNREEKSQQGMELLDTLEKELNSLQNLRDQKYDYTGYEEALQGLEALLSEESKKREHATDFSHCSYDSILRKRRDENFGRESEVSFGSNRFEMEVITEVLKLAENFNVNQFGFDETYGAMPSHLIDLEAGEDDWKSKDYFNQMDTCVEYAMQRQKEHFAQELSKIDARMLRSVIHMQQVERKIEPVSAFDYRSILLALVKSFLRAHLEDLAEKDATEKSDAAREAFLAELALDSKKSVGHGNDSSKNGQEKMKDKKRAKDSRRNRDLKAGSFTEPLEGAEPSSVSTATDDDNEDTDVLASERCNGTKPFEDDFYSNSQLEAEERLLEETLEYQRRIENEAKQKLIAEQRRKSASTVAGGTQDESVNFSTKSGNLVSVHYKHEPLASKNVFTDNLDGQQINLENGIDHSVIADGKANGEILDGEVFPSELQIVRKRKGKNFPKVSEGRSQTAIYGKENVKVERPVAHVMQKDQVWKDGDLSHAVGDGGSKTLRQLQAEEDDEERFQADLKKAVLQSLDTYQASQKFPSRAWEMNKSLQNVDKEGAKTEEVMVEDGKKTELVGAGLQNEVGEYNCFLNVIIQSLWHLRRFREEFLGRTMSEHVHVGDPCVVCALFDILTALSMASVDTKREPVAPTSLRIALSNLYPESNFFQEGQMNDASEVLGVIFECLHRSFTSGLGGSDCESIESNGMGSYDCTNPSCIAHTLFGMDIFERMNCYKCGLESRHLKYTSFFHNINASALRTMKAMCADNSFDELLNMVEMNHQLACDTEAGGCGKLNHIHHILSKPPHVFTTVLGWQKTCESVDDIVATLGALATELDISILYRGLDPKSVHRLVSVVCYYGQHYHCFAFSSEHQRWIMYDDKTVKVIGTWEDVLSMCEKGHLQPQVLFYEAVN